MVPMSHSVPPKGGTGQFVSRFVVTEGIAELLQFRYGKAIPMVGKRQEFEFVGSSEKNSLRLHSCSSRGFRDLRHFGHRCH